MEKTVHIPEPKLFASHFVGARAGERALSGESLRESLYKILDQAMAKHHQATLLDEKNAPGLVRSIEGMAQRAGLTHLPRVYLSPSWPSVYGGPNAAAVALPAGLGNVIVFNRPLLKTFNYELGNAAPCPEIQAVAAHEISHLRDGYAYNTNSRMIPMIAMPLVAMTALFIYDRTRKHLKDKEPTPENTLEALNAATGSLQERIDAHLSPVPLSGADAQVPGERTVLTQDNNFRSAIIDHGRYLVANVLGMGAGLLITRQYSLAAEYRADKFAAEMLGDGKPMINALLAFRRTSKEAFQTYAEAESKRPMSVTRSLNMLWREVEGMSTHAHPSLKQRAENLGLKVEPAGPSH